MKEFYTSYEGVPIQVQVMPNGKCDIFSDKEGYSFYLTYNCSVNEALKHVQEKIKKMKEHHDANVNVS